MIYFRRYFESFPTFNQSERFRDRLFSTLISLKSRLFTGVVDLVNGIAHLIGRIKRGFSSPKVETVAQKVFGKTPPVGFGNYGNSCWLATEMQLLLACEQFEGIVRAPLRATEVTFRDKGILQKRPETPYEFETRQMLQQALIKIIDASKALNQEAMTAALKEFHLCMLERQYPTRFEFPCIGKMGIPSTLFELVPNLFPGDVFYWCQPRWIHYLKPDAFSQRELEIMAKIPYEDQRPKICIFPAHWAVNDFRLDEQIDLSNHFEDGKFNLVGITHDPWRGHTVARVRYQNQTYQCDDSRVSKDSMIVNTSNFQKSVAVFLVVEKAW